MYLNDIVDRKTRNEEKFMRELDVLSMASVGVIVVRTREPYRCMEVLREFSANCEIPYFLWLCTEGWAEFAEASSYARTNLHKDTKDIFKAMTWVDDDEQPEGVYAMLWPHPWLKQNVGLMTMVKMYVHKFIGTRKHMVLIVPQTWAPPEEIKDDLVVVDFEAPSYLEMRDTYANLMSAQKNAPRFSDEDVSEIVNAGAGLTLYEFQSALARSFVVNKDKLPDVSLSDFRSIISDIKVEAVKKTETLEVLPAEDIQDVGGLDLLKEWISKRAHCFSNEAREFGIEAPRGVLCVGPPGSGKSLIAKATASVLRLPLIKFDVGRVFGSLVGQSEQRIKATLSMVEAISPCVLLVDEVDKAFDQNSSGGDSGVSKRVLGQFLTWMAEKTNIPVFVVMTANNVMGLPPELLRKGRLDEIFSVTLPDEADRRDIFAIHLRKRGHDIAGIDDIKVAIDQSKGYVPAEMESAVKDALIEAFTERKDLTGRLIAEQLAATVPLSVAFKEKFSAMEEWANKNARPASGNARKIRTRTRKRAVNSIVDFSNTQTGKSMAIN